MRIFLCLVIAAIPAFVSAAAAYSIRSVDFANSGPLLIKVQTSTSPSRDPEWSLKGNVLEIRFAGARLDDKLGAKVDLTAPHALVQSASFFSASDDLVKGRLVLNGSLEGIAERISLRRERDSIQVSLQYPAGENVALGFLSEEQKPIGLSATRSSTDSAKFGWWQGLVALLVLIGAAVCSYFAVRFLRKQGQWKGSRKYLIEQLAYCSVGQKSGVSLIRVGKEFVLVGVTPQQVNLLSELPKLAAQYEEDSRFERGVFQQAVEEEFKKTRGIAGTT